MTKTTASVSASLELLDMGQSIAHTDYAVANFLHPWHPRFFGNVSALRKALRRAIAHRPSAQQQMLQQELTDLLQGLEISESSPEVTGAVLRGMESLRTAIADLNEMRRQDFFTALAYINDSTDDGDFLLEEWGYQIIFQEGADDDEIAETQLVSHAQDWLFCAIPKAIPLSKAQRNACASLVSVAEVMANFLENRRHIRLPFSMPYLPMYMEWLAGYVPQIASD